MEDGDDIPYVESITSKTVYKKSLKNQQVFERTDKKG